MTGSPHSTELRECGSPGRAPDDAHVLVLPPVPDLRERARRVMLDYLTDLLTPAFNQLRAAYGIEPEPPRAGPPVTPEQAKAAADEYWTPEVLRAEQREAELAVMGEKPSRQRKPRLDQAIAHTQKATGKPVISVILSDGTKLTLGEPEPTEASNPWLADLPKVKQ